MEHPQNTENRVAHDPAIPLLDIYPKNLEFEKIHAPLHSQQHCFQQARHGSSLSVHGHVMDKEAVVCMYSGMLVCCCSLAQLCPTL